jgi:Phage integrase, N-terminal SAM-like domain
MLVNEWAEILWQVLNVRPKTIQNYKHMYGKYLKPVMGFTELDLVQPVDLQRCLLALPPQTSRHCLMLVKTMYREATLYGHSTINPALGLKTPPIQISEKKFLTWEEVNKPRLVTANIENNRPSFFISSPYIQLGTLV